MFFVFVFLWIKKKIFQIKLRVKSFIRLPIGPFIIEFSNRDTIKGPLTHVQNKMPIHTPTIKLKKTNSTTNIHCFYYYYLCTGTDDTIACPNGQHTIQHHNNNIKTGKISIVLETNTAK